MTEEQNLPQAQSHEAAPYEASSPQGQPSTSDSQSGDGQSGAGQGRSRRRRRKRKGKGAGAGQGAQVPSQPGEQDGSSQSPLPSVQASVQASGDSSGQPRQQNNQGQPQGQGQGQGKKRFRKKNRGGSNAARNENPGNQINASPGNGFGGGFGNGSGGGQGNGQGRRRNKQRRGPVAFVGPMDHSYRETNGNFADSPPSTIETHRNGNGGGHRNDSYNGYNPAVNGNGNGNGYASEFAARPRSAGQPSAQELADAPTRIVCFIDDLFFTAKIQETARKLGVKVAFVKADKDTVAQLAGDDEESRPALIVFDLNNLNAKPLTLIPKLKAKLKKSTSIVGFLSHLQGDLKMKATEAGCDAVMPKSAFSQNLPNLLRRYGLVDELEGVEQ